MSADEKSHLMYPRGTCLSVPQCIFAFKEFRQFPAFSSRPKFGIEIKIVIK